MKPLPPIAIAAKIMVQRGTNAREAQGKKKGGCGALELNQAR